MQSVDAHCSRAAVHQDSPVPVTFLARLGELEALEEADGGGDVGEREGGGILERRLGPEVEDRVLGRDGVLGVGSVLVVGHHDREGAHFVALLEPGDPLADRLDVPSDVIALDALLAFKYERAFPVFGV